MVHVAILVKKPESIFTNGCYQQSYFLYKQLLKTKHQVSLIGVDSGYTVFEMTDTPIRYIGLSEDVSDIDVILMVSGVVSNEAWQKKMMMHGIPMINVVCGNLFILHQEEYVFDKHHILSMSLNQNFSEFWVLPMYRDYADYLKLLTNKPVYVTPYVWDTDIIEAYVTKENLMPLLRNPKLSNEKISLAIFEPNMSIHKTSLVPILMAEEYYRRYPERVHRVYHFCGKDVAERNKDFFDSLSIKPLIEHYPRMIMAKVLAAIAERGFQPVVLTHNHHNQLNFLHLELFWLDVPVIHNCVPFKSAGLFYHDSQLVKAVDLIEEARKSVPFRTKNGGPILDFYAPGNPHHVQEYDQHIQRVTSPAVENLHANFKSQVKAKAKMMKAKSAWNGDGILVWMGHPNQGEALDITLKSLALHTKLPVVCAGPSKMPPNGQSSEVSVWKPSMSPSDAILNSDFKRVMVMMPGVVVTQDPTLLFTSGQFEDVGALFWSDIYNHVRTHALQETAWCYSRYWDTEIPLAEPLFDTSVFLVDKTKVFPALALWYWFQEQSREMKYPIGDYLSPGDEMKLAFLASGCKYFQLQRHPGLIGGVFKDTGFVTMGYAHQIADKQIACARWFPDSIDKRGQSSVIAWVEYSTSVEWVQFERARMLKLFDMSAPYSDFRSTTLKSKLLIGLDES